ncbi:MAG: hypothetical protein M3253_04455 [Chloroflexota bacterium]|nr:hypothetical protein [Chloroflexota bacterium]
MEASSGRTQRHRLDRGGNRQPRVRRGGSSNASAPRARAAAKHSAA